MKKEELKKVSVLLHRFVSTVKKGKGKSSDGSISMICKHTGKHVVSEIEYKKVIEEMYKVDMSL